MAYEAMFEEEIGKGLEAIAGKLNVDTSVVIKIMLKDGIERYKRDDNYRNHLGRVLGK